MSLPSYFHRACRAVLVIAMTLGALAQPLRAQEATSEQTASDDEAHVLFEAGRMAFEQGRFVDAYQRFVQAYAMSPRSGLLYNIATAADRSDQTPEAIAAYAQYLAENPAVENRAFIEGRLAVLRARPAAQLPSAEVEVSDVQTETPASSPVQPTSPSVSDAPDQTASIVLFTLAGLVGAGAIVTGVMGWTARSELELHCPMRVCPDNALQSRANEMMTLGLVTDVLAGSSLALATAGLVAFLVTPAPSEQRALSLALGPTGVSLRGAF